MGRSNSPHSTFALTVVIQIEELSRGPGVVGSMTAKQDFHSMDDCDRLILALAAPLRGESETRHSYESCIAAGVLDAEILQAIVADPVQIITQDDINFAEVIALNTHRIGGSV